MLAQPVAFVKAVKIPVQNSRDRFNEVPIQWGQRKSGVLPLNGEAGGRPLNGIKLKRSADPVRCCADPFKLTSTVEQPVF